MKILQVSACYYPSIGGLQEHVRNISEQLSKSHDVTVSTTDSSGKLPREETVNNVKVLRFKSWAPQQSYYVSLELQKYLKQYSSEFDIVHAHCYHSFVPLYAAQGKGKNRFVFTSHYHGTGHTFFRSLFHMPYKFLGKKIFEKADKIVCVSNFERSLVLRNFKVDEKKVVVIPNGLNLEEFRGLKKRVENCRIILYVGRLERYKGMHYLIEALPKLDSDIVLEIVGKGPFKEHLVKLAKKLKVENRVRFFQDLPRKELLQRYVDASLFVLLSRYEAYGISVAESLAAGVPCLVANSSALTEWIDNTHCFGIDLPINVDDLVIRLNENVGKRINKPNLPSWADIAEQTVKTYNSLL